MPEVGVRKPVSRLNKVVLPAPFGPTRACTLPSATSRSTPWTAAKPRNSLVSARVRSSAVEGAVALGHGCCLRAALHGLPPRWSGSVRGRTEPDTRGRPGVRGCCDPTQRVTIAGLGPHMPSGYADPMATTVTQEARLLELLAAGASAADIAAVDTDPVLRDLALQVRAVTDLRRRREQELEVLVETAQDLATLDDPALVLEAIVARARTLLGTDLAYLTLYDAQGGDTFMRATPARCRPRSSSYASSSARDSAAWSPRPTGPPGRPTTSRDDRFLHTAAHRHRRRRRGHRRASAAPHCSSRTSSSGVLFAANRSPRTFTPDEVALLGSLAALAAVSLVQVSALDTVRRHTEGLERAAAAHDRFAGIVLRGGGVGEITEALHSLLGVWVVLVDDEGVERSAAGPVPELPQQAPTTSGRTTAPVRRRRPAGHCRPAGPHGRPLGRGGLRRRPAAGPARGRWPRRPRRGRSPHRRAGRRRHRTGAAG